MTPSHSVHGKPVLSGRMPVLFVVLILLLALVPVAAADATNNLNITGNVVPVPATAVFAKEPNAVTILSVKNTGTETLTNIPVALYASDVSDGTVAVNSTVIPSLAGGSSTTVNIIDPTIRALEGGTVTYTAAVDPDNIIEETNETDNTKSSAAKTVKYNGYKGKRYWEGGSDITTRDTYDLNGGLLVSTQSSAAYQGVNWVTRTETWSASDLALPAGATVEKAILYLPYNWDTTSGGAPDWSASFNGNTLTGGTLYTDKSNFGSYANYVYGLYSYNVTGTFSSSGNTLVMTPNTGNSNALYPSTLVVIYRDANATRKQIFVNEECDELLYGESSYGTNLTEATAYVPFTNLTVDTASVTNATLYSFAASAGISTDEGEGNLFFNGNTLGTNYWKGSASTANATVTDVKSYLTASDNLAAIQGTSDGGMLGIQQILVVEYNATSSATVPVASFTADVTNGTAPLTVNFTDTSSNSPTSWLWDFGDGNTSTVQNPAYTYPDAGNFTVNLTVSNTAGNDTLSNTDYISVSAASMGETIPVALFSANQTSGTAPLTVLFLDYSENSPTTWFWDFGDGANSTEQNATHTYSDAGNFTVSLTVANTAGNDTLSNTDYITVSAATGGESVPVALFSANQTSGTAPLTILFLDYSENSPTEWLWDFGDGANSTEQNATHTYTAAGNYTVNLTVTNTAGNDTLSNTDYISVSAASGGSTGPVAAFSADKTYGGVPLTVQFTDTSTGSPTTWSWDFGDGNTSTIQNPSHTYVATGTYTVILTAENAGESNTTEKTGYVTVGNTITVAADGSGDYTTISDAVSAAASGDIIYVKAGTYTEPSGISINQSNLHIIGEGVDKVLLKAPHQIIEFLQPGCSLENMSMRNGRIYSRGDSTVIQNTTYYSPDGGPAYTFTTSNNILANNVVVNANTQYAISFSGPGRYNRVHDNTVSGTTYSSSAGAQLNKQDFLIFENNTIRDGSYYGVYINGTNNIFRYNTIMNNSQNATFLFKTKENNTIYLNAIFGNGALIKPYVSPMAPSWVSPTEMAYTYNGSSYSAILGNYWGSSYTDPDSNNDGIGDTALTIPSSMGNDTAPLMGIWQNGAIVGGPDSIAPGAGFLEDNFSGQAPLVVQFNAYSPGPGTITSYSWDFGDNTTSTEKDPTHTYTTAGTYTVTLTVTGPGGSTEVVKSNLITVTSAGAELYVSSLSPLSALTANNITATIQNDGTTDTVAFKANFTVNGTTTEFTVAGIGAGNTTTISVTDPVTTRKYGDIVPISIALDTEDAVSETNETNNTYSVNAIVGANGNYYKGGRFYTGYDLETGNYTEGHIALIHAWGNSTYTTDGGWYTRDVEWTSSDLPVPANATVKSARVYQSYTWEDYGDPGFTLTFNGNTVPQTAFYGDGVDNYNGQAIYDVTPYFSSSGNTAEITAAKPDGGLYATVLVVVYEDSSEPYRMIWLDEGSDTLYNAEGTSTDPYIAYAMFGNVTTASVGSAKLTTILPSGADNSQSTILFNNQSVAIIGAEGSNQAKDPGFKWYDVTGKLQAGTNELGVKYDGSYLNLAGAILEVTLESPPEASFSAATLSGTVPLTIQFTDKSLGATSWSWDFGDGDTTNATEQNPVHTYETAGNYTVNLTAANAYGSDTETKEAYVTVTGGSGGSGTVPVAAFSTSVTNGLAPVTAGFTDSSTNTPTNWTWEYRIADNGTWTTFSTEQNPSYEFTSAGTYDIRLTATNADGNNTLTKYHVFAAATEHDYLTTIANGTVTGDLYVNSVSPWGAQGGSTHTQSYTLPDYTDIQWARVFVNDYSGAGVTNYPVLLTTEFDADGDGTFETQLGNETCNIKSGTNGYAYPLNDHVTKVYSDYEAWYDVTGLINSTTPKVRVTAAIAPGQTSLYDGRIKAVTLVVAYNNGSSSRTNYWVNHGSDWTTESSSTTFGTSSLVTGWTNAEIRDVGLSSTDAAFTLNGNSITATSLGTGAYYKYDAFNVTDNLTAGSATTFGFTNAASSYKISLATLAVKYPAASAVAPVASFTANMTSGTAPLTVNFTDTSSNSPTEWLWEFGDGSNSTEQNATHTYSSAGIYAVNLTATNSAGSNSSVKAGYISVTSGGSSGSGLADSAWPKFQRDNNNSGLSPYVGAQTNDVLWTYTTAGNIYGSPVIGSEGTIYVGTYDNNLYAVNKNGTLKWSYTSGGKIYGAPAIGSDGTIYFGNIGDKKIYAVNPDGTLNWTYTTGGIIYGSPAIGSDGIIYIASFDKNIYALNSDGTLKWNYATGGSIESSPAIGSDGTIYIGTYGDKKVYALNSDGSLKWNYTTGGAMMGSPAIGSDGTIYIGNYGDYNVYAFNPDGTLKWNYTTGGKIYGSPAIGSEGTIYIGSYDKNVYALNSDGTLKWNYTAGGTIEGTPAIGSDGTIYIGSYSDKSVYAINSDGSLKWNYTTGGAIYGSPAIGSDGIVYFGSYDKKMYAFGTLTPVASFTASNTSGDAPFTVTFTDQSSYNPTAWTWDFGDGDSTNATVQNPVHTYASAGTYTVNLTVTNTAGSNTTMQARYITVSTPPVKIDPSLFTGHYRAYVNGTPTALTDYQVKFVLYNVTGTDSSENIHLTGIAQPDYNDVRFALSDGTQLNYWMETPTGTDNATFWAKVPSIPAGSDNSVAVDIYYGNSTIESGADGDATFPLFDNFDESSLNTTKWTLVSGTSPTAGNSLLNLKGTTRVHSNTYFGTNASIRSYGNLYGYMQLIGFKEATSGTNDVYVMVAGSARTLSFYTYVDTVLVTPATDCGTLSDTYQNMEISWNSTMATYQVGNNSPVVRDSAQNATLPVYLYSSSNSRIGYYDWIFVRQLADTEPTVYQPESLPVAGFSADATTGAAPLTVQFTDASTGFPSTWAWDFNNDGVVDSTLPNPTYKYSSAGTYTVNLTVSNAGGSNSMVKSDFITVSEAGTAPRALFSANTTSGTAPLIVAFTDESTGVITSWVWDFGDGTNATTQNATHRYSTAGKYTVSLTATGPDGSDTLSKADYISVTTEVPGVDLSGTAAYATTFAHYNNTITATIRNGGTENATAFNVTLGIDGNSTTLGIPALAAGNSTTVSITDAADHLVNATVALNLTIDPENAVPESSETNNNYSATATMIYNGYAGHRWSSGDDLTTKKVIDIRGDSLASLGNSIYGSDTVSWTSSDLPIPEGATVQEALLYVPYTWDWQGNMLGTTTMTFNGVTVPHDAHYREQKDWGAWSNYAYGVFIYNVTGRFNASGNTASFNHSYAPVRGMNLVVVYEDANATEKQIFINDGFDMLFASSSYYTTPETATAYAPFNGPEINLSRVKSATITSSISRGSGRGTMLFNGNTWTGYWAPGAGEVGLNSTDITPYLTADNNTVLIRSPDEGWGIEAYLAILKVEYEGTTAVAPVASFTASNMSGTAPLLVAFTDTSTNSPTSWTWDFGDGASATTRNATHTYTAAGNYTVRLTATNRAGSSSTVKYILVSKAVSAPAAGFSANKTEGDVPMSVKFTDKSTNSPTNWNWTFGDGNTSTVQNPVHTYAAAGTYTVSLTASNSAGSDAVTKSGYITVVAPVVTSNSFAVTGVSTATNGTSQEVSIDTTAANVTKSGNTVTVNATGSWSELAITMTDPVDTNATTINGTVAAVTAVTEPVTATVASAGTSTVQIQLNMTGMPSSTAAITQTITKDPDPTAQSAFTVAATGAGKEIEEIAYTINVAKTNLANAGDGGIIRSATLTMTVSSSWVAAHGGTGSLVVMRMADDGTTQILTPTVTGPDGSGNYVLTVVSPSGLSTFSVAAVTTASSSTTTAASGESESSSDDSASLSSVTPGSGTRLASISTSFPSIASGESSTIAVNQVATTAVPYGISSVQITAAGGISASSLLVSDGSNVDTSQLDGRPVAGITRIEAVGVNPSSISSAVITFAISKSWLTENGLATSDVVLARNSNGNWVELPTSFSYQSGDTYYFTATTPGFSYFAVTKKSADVTATTAATATVAAASPENEPAAATPVVASVTAQSTTVQAANPGVTSAATAVPTAKSGSMPIVTLGIIGAALVIAVQAIAFCRRGKIRR